MCGVCLCVCSCGNMWESRSVFCAHAFAVLYSLRTHSTNTQWYHFPVGCVFGIYLFVCVCMCVWCEQCNIFSNYDPTCYEAIFNLHHKFQPRVRPYFGCWFHMWFALPGIIPEKDEEKEEKHGILVQFEIKHALLMAMSFTISLGGTPLGFEGLCTCVDRLRDNPSCLIVVPHKVETASRAASDSASEIISCNEWRNNFPIKPN